MKKISILGSTGSIGTQTLDVIREHGDMQVVALSCGRNLSLIEKQAREFKPQFVSVSDENDAKKLRTSLLNVAETGIVEIIQFNLVERIVGIVLIYTS